MSHDDRLELPRFRSLPSVDVSRLVGDVSRTFNPLAHDFDLHVHAQALPDDKMQLTVVMPAGMSRAFVALLESMTGFVRFVDHKTRIAAGEAKAIDPVEIEQRRATLDAYTNDVCKTFDGFTASGLERREALKQTCRALKAKGCPWATHDLVQETLRRAGRFRTSRGARKT